MTIMDLKHYYQKMREIEAKIVDEFPLVVSRETPDGGKEGTKTEVPKKLAAKLIVEGLARLASDEEKNLFRSLQAEAIRAAEQLAAAARMQVTVLASSELDRLRKAAAK
jgi:hypothetical protein